MTSFQSLLRPVGRLTHLHLPQRFVSQSFLPFPFKHFTTLPRTLTRPRPPQLLSSPLQLSCHKRHYALAFPSLARFADKFHQIVSQKKFFVAYLIFGLCSIVGISYFQPRESPPHHVLYDAALDLVIKQKLVEQMFNIFNAEIILRRIHPKLNGNYGDTLQFVFDVEVWVRLNKPGSVTRVAPQLKDQKIEPIENATKLGYFTIALTGINLSEEKERQKWAFERVEVQRDDCKKSYKFNAQTKKFELFENLPLVGLDNSAPLRADSRAKAKKGLTNPSNPGNSTEQGRFFEKLIGRLPFAYAMVALTFCTIKCYGLAANRRLIFSIKRAIESDPLIRKELLKVQSVQRGNEVVYKVAKYSYVVTALYSLPIFGIMLKKILPDLDQQTVRRSLFVNKSPNARLIVDNPMMNRQMFLADLRYPLTLGSAHAHVAVRARSLKNSHFSIKQNWAIEHSTMDIERVMKSVPLKLEINKANENKK